MSQPSPPRKLSKREQAKADSIAGWNDFPTLPPMTSPPYVAGPVRHERDSATFASQCDTDVAARHGGSPATLTSPLSSSKEFLNLNLNPKELITPNTTTPEHERRRATSTSQGDTHVAELHERRTSTNTQIARAVQDGLAKIHDSAKLVWLFLSLCRIEPGSRFTRPIHYAEICERLGVTETNLRNRLLDSLAKRWALRWKVVPGGAKVYEHLYEHAVIETVCANVILPAAPQALPAWLDREAYRHLRYREFQELCDVLGEEQVRTQAAVIVHNQGDSNVTRRVRWPHKVLLKLLQDPRPYDPWDGWPAYEQKRTQRERASAQAAHEAEVERAATDQARQYVETHRDQLPPVFRNRLEET